MNKNNIKIIDSQSNYFFIDFKMIEKDSIFPFHLYIFNPQSSSHTIYLYANSPLTQEKKDFLKLILDKGGEIAIQYKQKKTFLTNRDLKEDDIPDLMTPALHELIQKQSKIQEKQKALEEQEGQFQFDMEFKKSVAKDDFMPLITEVRNKGILLPYTLSPTVSLGIYLCETLLIEDNFTNRIVALSYLFSKQLGIDDQISQGEIIVAAFLCHLGHTQIDLRYSHIPQLKHKTKERKKYRQHPGLAAHLIRKSEIEISDRCNRIIYQHHERFDGNGYPENKKAEFIEPLALILGFSSHILEFQSGKITGDKIPLKTVLSNFISNSTMTGLELQFGDLINENVGTLLKNKNTTSRAA